MTVKKRKTERKKIFGIISRSLSHSRRWMILRLNLSPVLISLQKLTYSSSQNVRNAVRNMRHVLTVDPSRRFTYGIDIEGTELGLWIATRAMVIACDTFDFRTVSLL